MESKLPTTNYLSPGRVHLYHKIDATVVKSRRQARQSLAALASASCTASLLMTCLIWYTPRPDCAYAHCITKSSVYTISNNVFKIRKELKAVILKLGVDVDTSFSNMCIDFRTNL